MLLLREGEGERKVGIRGNAASAARDKCTDRVKRRQAR